MSSLNNPAKLFLKWLNAKKQTKNPPRNILRVEPNVTRIRVIQQTIQEEAEENTTKVSSGTVGWSTVFSPLEVWM